MTLQEELHVLLLSSDGKSWAEIAQETQQSLSNVDRIIAHRGRITKCRTPNPSRRFLELSDKLKIICRAECGELRKDICDEFQISPRTYKRILHKKDEWKAEGRRGCPLKVKRMLAPKYPALEAELKNFVSFARQLRLPVTINLIQERARIAACTLGLSEFKASNGYIERFVRRSQVKNSVRLHGRGGSSLPTNNEECMERLRAVSQNYPLRNICNMDESGLFYWMGPRRSYFAPTESSQTVRGTDLQRSRARMSIVLCVNGDGSHFVPVQYIGHSANPRCFRDNRFSELKTHYRSQANAWMDSTDFNVWIGWWYNEVRKFTQEDVLLITDNCGGHESGINYPGLRIEFLPPRSTAKYQTLDLGLISQSKIRYRSILLKQVVDNTMKWDSGEHHFPPTSNSGKWGVRDGHLPHVGDAMYIFNEAWRKTSRSTILKCWIKSKCLSEMQVQEANNIINAINGANETDSSTDTVPIQEAEEIYTNIQAHGFLSTSGAPASSVINDIADIENLVQFLQVLNMEIPEDEERNRNQIAQEKLQSMYDSANQVLTNESEVSNPSPNTEATITASQLCAKVQEILDVEPSFQLDEHLKDALQIALLRAEELKSRVEQA